MRSTTTLMELLQNSRKSPLQIMGTINAYCALLAQRAGAKALYLSGAGVANAQFGWPDLGLTSLTDVCCEINRITQICDLPLLVDADTGWGSTLNIENSVKLIEKAGASGLHIEDQIFPKRCGHREGKKLISVQEMVERVSIACQAKKSPDFLIMARTDGLAVENQSDTLERILAYEAAGAQAIFLEAVTSLEQISFFKAHVKTPLMINLTEFGKTPLWHISEVAGRVDALLYPLTAFRAMSLAASQIYQGIINEGSQKQFIGQLQTRNELYDILNYYAYEARADQDIQSKGA